MRTRCKLRPSAEQPTGYTHSSQRTSRDTTGRGKARSRPHPQVGLRRFGTLAYNLYFFLVNDQEKLGKEENGKEENGKEENGKEENGKEENDRGLGKEENARQLGKLCLV